MTQTAMTPTETQNKVVMPKRPRRISPDFAEVLHMLASFDAQPDHKAMSDKT